MMLTDAGYIVETTRSGRTYEEQPDGSFIEVTEDVDYEQHCRARCEELKGRLFDEYS